jgi:hypothetical protein
VFIIFAEKKCITMQDFSCSNKVLRNIRDSPEPVIPACARSGEGSDHFDLMYAAFPCISARGCFQDFNP